jgi:hypothetical protein
MHQIVVPLSLYDSIIVQVETVVRRSNESAYITRYVICLKHWSTVVLSYQYGVQY